MDDESATMRVSVCYGEAHTQWLVDVDVPKQAVVGDVLALDAVKQGLPDGVLDAPTLGIFSVPCDLNTPLHAHDRIEIYRPLVCDPKTMRRERAQIKRDADEARKKARKKRLK